MDLTERLMHQESNSSAQRSRDTPVPPAQHPATTEFLNTPYFLNTISPSLNLPMMNLNPNRVVAPQPQPTTRHALDLVNALTQPQLLSNLAFPATLPQQMLPQQYMVQPEQPCVCQPTSTRQNPSSSSSLPLNRHRKRPHREESSDSSRPKYSRNGALEPVRSVPVNVRSERVVATIPPSRPAQSSATQPTQPTVLNPVQPSVCLNCRRPDERLPYANCNCEMFHTCNLCPCRMQTFLQTHTNNYVQRHLQQPQQPQQQQQLHPPLLQITLDRPGSSANGQRTQTLHTIDPNVPLPCLNANELPQQQQQQSEQQQLDSAIIQHMLQQQQQRMRPIQQQQQLLLQQLTGAYRPQRPSYTPLAQPNIHPEHAQLLAMRQQQARTQDEMTNRFYQQRPVQVQTTQLVQTDNYINPIASRPIMLLPNNIEMISLMMNQDLPATFLLHNPDTTAHVAHAMNHSEPQPIGATTEAIKRCTQIRNYVKDPNVPEREKERCTVCLIDFDHGDEIRTLHCTHIYHVSCIDRWLNYNKKCPVCRVDMDKAQAVINIEENAVELFD